MDQLLQFIKFTYFNNVYDYQISKTFIFTYTILPILLFLYIKLKKKLSFKLMNPLCQEISKI